MDQAPLHLRFGRFELDEARHALLEDGSPVAVGPKPLAILFLLARHRARVVRKEELLRVVWSGTYVSDDAVWQCIFKVRAALGDEGASRIATVRGVGFRFLGEAHEAAALAPSGNAALSSRSAPLVGREAELGVLRSALARTAGSGGGLLLLLGEPGIGKTRLAEELLAEARSVGFEVHETRSAESPAAPAFWLWAQLLRSCAELWSPAQLRSVMGAAAADLGRLAPELRGVLEIGPPENADSADACFRIFEGLDAFLKRASRNAPQLILLDDLQWADADSLAALSFLAPSLRRERVLLLATVREHDLARNEPLQDAVIAFAKADTLVRVALRGLEPSEVGRLVAQRAGVEVPEAVVEMLHRRAGGNPFFVGQVLELMPMPGSGAPRPAGSLDSLAIPAGMQRIASKRLASLSPAGRELLELAAVSGKEFSFALLAQARSGERTRLLEALDEGAALHLVSPCNADRSA